MASLHAIAQDLDQGTISSEYDLEFLVDEDWPDVPEPFFLPEDKQASPLVIIDAEFDRRLTRSFLILDSLLWLLLSNPLMVDGNSRVVVLVESLPRVVDQAHDLLRIESIEGRLMFTDATGESKGNIGDLDMGLVGEVLGRHPAPKPGVLDNIVRHRAVFRSQPGGRRQYHLYHYEPFDRAVDFIQNKLYNYIVDSHADVVIYDSSNAGPWFRSAVTSACTYVQAGLGIELEAVDAAKLSVDGVSLSGAISVEGSSLADLNIVVVVPALDTGRTVGRVYGMLGTPEPSSIKFISVFAASESEDEESRSTVATTRRVNYGSQRLSIDCLLHVPIRTMSDSNWKVKVAQSVGCVYEAPNVPALGESPSLVSLWSLFEDYGVDIEFPVPADRRRPLKYFPVLAHLDHWDAHWLAELVVGQILKASQGSNQSAMLLVMPSEPGEGSVNGTGPIAMALVTKCQVAVQLLPRNVIEGDGVLSGEIRAKLRKHRGDTIAIFDESTISHKSLLRMAQIVAGELDADVDSIVTLLNAGDFVRPKPERLISIFRWQALTESYD